MEITLKEEIENINRLRHIINVLIEGGFGYVVSKIHLKPVSKAKQKAKKKIPTEVRLRRILEKLGPTFIKFGQVLSIRSDLVPESYVKELSKLQDKVPPFPYEQVKKIVEEEFNKPLEQVFPHFEKKPIASGSIAQVHKAKVGGKIVAVKVKRPNIDRIIKEDVEIMDFIAHLLEKNIPKIRKYNPIAIVNEFANWTKQELDFTNEAKNIKQFYKNFEGNPKVKIPKVYDKLSKRNILTMEFIDGIEIHDFKRLKAEKIDVRKGLSNGLDVMLTQIFEHGLFHGDPHPGNMLVLKDGRIAFVDFGIVGHFNKKLTKASLDIFDGIVEFDADKIVEAFLKIGMIKSCIDIEAFRDEIEEIIEPLQSAKMKDLKTGNVLEQLFDLGIKYNIKVPLSFVLFAKTILTLEGVGLEFSPNFKLAESTRPFLERLIKRKINLIGMPTELIRSLIRFRKFIKEFPKETTKALKKIQEGKLKIEIEDTDIKRLSLEIDRSSNRLAYGMVIAALIIAGALTINVDMFKLFGIPLISLFTYLMAGFLGIILLLSIMSEQELKR